MFLTLYQINNRKPVFLMATFGHQNVTIPTYLGIHLLHFSVWGLLGKEDQDLSWVFCCFFLLLQWISTYICNVTHTSSFMEGEWRFLYAQGVLKSLKCSCLHHGLWQMLSRAWNKIGNDGKIFGMFRGGMDILISCCNSTGWHRQAAIVSWKKFWGSFLTGRLWSHFQMCRYREHIACLGWFVALAELRVCSQNQSGCSRLTEMLSWALREEHREL